MNKILELLKSLPGFLSVVLWLLALGAIVVFIFVGMPYIISHFVDNVFIKIAAILVIAFLIGCFASLNPRRYSPFIMGLYYSGISATVIIPFFILGERGLTAVIIFVGLMIWFSLLNKYR